MTGRFLQVCYQYQHKLREKLLQGARWQEVRSQRRDVTELATAIYERLNRSLSNPAEFNSRKES